MDHTGATYFSFISHRIFTLNFEIIKISGPWSIHDEKWNFLIFPIKQQNNKPLPVKPLYVSLVYITTVNIEKRLLIKERRVIFDTYEFQRMLFVAVHNRVLWQRFNTYLLPRLWLPVVQPLKLTILQISEMFVKITEIAIMKS